MPDDKIELTFFFPVVLAASIIYLADADQTSWKLTSISKKKSENIQTTFMNPFYKIFPSEVATTNMLVIEDITLVSEKESENLNT
jgi:hypothetical protein